MELDQIHHQASPERFPLHSLERRKADIVKLFAQDHLFYAEDRSQIIGFASVVKRKDALVIEHLYVEPEFRHQKVATKIVEKIFEKIPDKEIFASVYAFNSPAIKFYDQLFELSSLVFKRSKQKIVN
ncbi:MAG: GNAT family N-acetyltransferase [Verrucomicrobia bacterium]|nr:GNAT family N-acetyltransferase [Verrucomicrobiota bacterium]